ncbi:MAG: hypothetical protein U9P68_00745 [Pseudomonadota bacterium]|nr:hypothetical protein [Pseudomonadota bacterium]
MKTFLMISAATLFGATAALAQDNETFVTLDSNQNGAVSYDEAVIADPALDRASFEAQDTDGNGSLNVAEFEAWLEGRAEAEADVESEPADGQPHDLTPDTEAEIEAETGIGSRSEAGIDPMDDPMTDTDVGGQADAGLDAEGTLEDPMRG